MNIHRFQTQRTTGTNTLLQPDGSPTASCALLHYEQAWLYATSQPVSADRMSKRAAMLRFC